MNMNTKSATNALDKIHQQVMWNRLIAVVEEQAQTILRTAFGSVVREAGDLSAGIYDLEGRMIAQAVTGTPGHVNTMARAVEHFLTHYPVDQMKQGDVYVTNDPWLGTGHLFDFVVVSPAYYGGNQLPQYENLAALDRREAFHPPWSAYNSSRRIIAGLALTE